MTTRTICRAALLAVGMTALAGAVTAQDKKQPEVPKTIKELMKKGHGAKGPLKSIAKEAKDGKWDDAKTNAELLKLFGENLYKLDPPMGSKESWKKLTDKYEEQTGNVYKAVDKKDVKKTEETLKKLGGGCKECHDAHKGK